MPNLHDDGYIKFNCVWHQKPWDEKCQFFELQQCRDALWQKKLIGMYEDGIGFGNVSIRSGNWNQFIITGTQTGGEMSLTRNGYTLVSAFDISKNEITCEGPAKASSESLTHAVLYASCKDIQAIIHTHHHGLWEALRGRVPTTDKKVEYGTIEMAEEMKRLVRDSDVTAKKILVMAGHEDGVISFGQDLSEAMDILLGYLEKI